MERERTRSAERAASGRTQSEDSLASFDGSPHTAPSPLQADTYFPRGTGISEAQRVIACPKSHSPNSTSGPPDQRPLLVSATELRTAPRGGVGTARPGGTRFPQPPAPGPAPTGPGTRRWECPSERESLRENQSSSPHSQPRLIPH